MNAESLFARADAKGIRLLTATQPDERQWFVHLHDGTGIVWAYCTAPTFTKAFATALAEAERQITANGLPPRRKTIAEEFI